MATVVLNFALHEQLGFVLNQLGVLWVRPDKLVSLNKLVNCGTQGDRVDAEILIILEGKGVLNDHGSRLQEGVKNVQIVSLDLLVYLLVIMLKLVH